MDDISSHKQHKRSQVDGTSKNDTYRMRLHYTLGDAQEMRRQRTANASSSTLFSRGTRTRTFFTADSHRYITPLEQEAMLSGVHRYERTGHFDSVQMRYSRPTKSASDLLYRQLQERYSSIRETFSYLPDMLAAHISPARVWNASIVGAIFFGMFSMTLIYRYLGQQVSAESTTTLSSAPVMSETIIPDSVPAVLGATTDRLEEEKTQEKITPVPPAVIQKNLDQIRFEAKVTEMVKGYPIEAMLPYILKQDRDVAMFLIAIGKKESNWGKRAPVLGGQDCYNYWGYRGIRDKMGSGGHTCFESTADAVNTVAKRIKTLVQEKKLNTPAKMIVWKCGSSCAGHSSEGVGKWISDVDMYIKALK
ncbi:MAG: hypothetical protein PHT88_05585 [Candidatus Moranbacteria bacterium]|nr:hypothetical protein [Candidatus Moranbacteria bacterium]